MSFFGFGGKKEPEAEPSYSSSSYDEPSYDYSNSQTSSAFESAAPASAGSFSAGDMQAILIEEQQRALVQQAISKITAIAWDKCSASKPDAELSSRERDCIKNVTLAYLDTTMFVVHRLNKSA